MQPLSTRGSGYSFISKFLPAAVMTAALAVFVIFSTSIVSEK
jgi:hypothetical protein